MNFKRLFAFSLVIAIMSGTLLMVTAFRSVKVYQDVTTLHNHIRYMIDSGESIATAPAESALSANYLEIIFGDNPQLLDQLLEIIQQGMAANPDVSLGEVASIIVTYRKTEEGDIEDVVAHIIGEFPLGQRPVNMHQGGYLQNRLDENLWGTGFATIRFLGRDIIVWAKDETIERPQQEILESIFAGEILVLAESIVQKPLFYTAVFPAPRDIVPLRMRPHLRAMLYNGSISPKGGGMEMVALCNNERSAERVLGMFQDLLDSARVTLQARFGGTIIETAWNPEQVDVWWAYELAEAIEKIELTQSEQTVRLSSSFERSVVNAMLKVVQRFGRDYSAIRGVQDEKINPEAVQEFMSGNPNTPRWSNTHKWGPDWPFAPSAGTMEIQRLIPEGIEPP